MNVQSGALYHPTRYVAYEHDGNRIAGAGSADPGRRSADPGGRSADPGGRSSVVGAAGMTDPSADAYDPFSEPSDTREEILGAAFQALCEHGYSDLTIQRIGDAFEKSPSLVYHHYDGKDELLLDLLEFLLEGFEETLSDGSAGFASGEPCATSPRNGLEEFVRATIDPETLGGAVPDEAFMGALVELRAQAAHDEAYRAHFDRSDRVFRRFLERTVAAAAAETEPAPGSASRDVPVSEVAATLQTLAAGGTLRRATTTDRDWVAEAAAGIDRYLDAMLPRVVLEE